MELQLLFTTDALSIYRDEANCWLYIDWQGHLTLPMVQRSCVSIAQCFLEHSFTRVLNDNTNVLSISPDVAPWLAKEYLPYIVLGDIQHLAWVYSRNFSTRYYTDLAVFAVNSPTVALFSDLASACSWLKSATFKQPIVLEDANPDLDKLMELLNANPNAYSLIEVMATRGIHLPPGQMTNATLSQD